jgi:hypothetical protein
MIGSVLTFELLRASRRGWHHWLLWIYGGWLLLQVVVVFLLHLAGHWDVIHQREVQPELFAAYSQKLVEQLVVQQFLLLFLVVPAFAAGSISDDKIRGTLQEWLITDLNASEIVGGKLVAQVVQIGTLSLAGLPLFAFFGAFAGMDLGALAALLLTVLVQLMALSAASLLASVWCKRTTTAVFSVYLAALALFAFARWLRLDEYFHPFYLLKAAWLHVDHVHLIQRLLRMGLAWGTVVVVCWTLAVWRLRPAYRRQLASEGIRAGSLRGLHHRPPVSSNPLRWKERWLGEVPLPPALRRLSRPFAVAGTTLLTLAVGAWILLAHLPPTVGWRQVLVMALTSDIPSLLSVWRRSTPSSTPFLLLALTVMAVFTLGVGIRCSGVVSGERERKSWETLLTTPMEPRHILRGKLWGVIDSARPYLLAYIIPATVLAAAGGLLAVLWVVFWWALTWMMMYFMGATGVRCSVRSQNSWRSLLASLLSNAWVIGMRYLMFGAPIGGLATGLVIGVLQATLLPPGMFGTVVVVSFVMLSLGLTMFWLIAEAEFQLNNAEQWIYQHERVSPLKTRVPRVLRG